jgi:ubiquinol-cytochrome c reductase cytochrome c subunit
MRLLRWWWRRPPRAPYGVRILIAAGLASLGLLGIVNSSVGLSNATRPTTAPTKQPDDPGPSDRTTRFPSSAALVAQGRSLYDNGCASCHGLALQGRSGIAPSLLNVGAGPVDFYVSTGRMPLQAPTDEPERARPVYDDRQTQALVALVTSVGTGPKAAPAADPAAGSLSTGQEIFTESCAGCHQMIGRGGLTVGAWVPDLQQATAPQIAEAVRMGPYVMPHFNSEQIDQQQLDSLTRYVLWTRHPDNPGGWGIGNIGPIPEGIAAWFIALLALVIVARLIGERTQGAEL